ncbi:MAG: hypothetical protein ACRDIB_10320, partial [Ardenticatenaceae bacterium]
ALPQTVPPPADTIAYLAEYTASLGGRLAGLLALSPDGATQRILSTNGAQLFWGYVSSGEQDNFLLHDSANSGCGQEWLFLYEPSEGIVGHWLTSPAHASFYDALWRDDQEDILLVGSAGFAGSDYPYVLIEPGGPLLIESRGVLHAPQHDISLIDWWGDSGQIVSVDHQEPRAGVALIDFTSGEVTRSFAPPQGLGIRAAQSMENHQLLYLTEPIMEGQGETSLRKLNLTTGDEVLLLRGSDERLYNFVAATEPGDSRVLVLAGPIEPQQQGRKRLLVVDRGRPKGQPGQRTVVAEVTEGAIDSMLPCSEGRILYTVSVPIPGGEAQRPERTTRLYLWHPDGHTTLLYESNESVTLWACE